LLHFFSASAPNPVTSLRQKRIPLWFLLSLCVSATAWLYVHQILIPWADAKDLQKGGLKAQMWDLYPRWVGARELLLRGRNPYGPEVSREIQIAFYGHAVTPEEAARHAVDEQRFAYPLYVVFLMAPTINTDFATVQFWASYVLGLFAGLTVAFSVGLLDWRLPWATIAALILFTLSSPQIIQGMRHQQLALVAASLLTAGAWCVHRGHLVSAGVLLAFCTIKPQMALLPLIWFVLWAAGEWRTRWRLLAGFGVTMAGLIGAGELLLPGWLGYFFAGIAAYRKYFPTTSLLRLLLGDTLGIVVSVFIIVCVLIFGWRNRSSAGDSRQFVLMVAAFLMATVLTFPLFTPFNQALLILPALLVVRNWAALSKLSRLTFIALVSWPWITSTLLLLLRPTLNPASQIPLLPAFVASFVPIILPLLLFTGREISEDRVHGATVS
jgi:hypothetical protein